MAEANAAEDLAKRLQELEIEAKRAAELDVKCGEQATALETETSTRKELEDMLSRIEKHFKAEQTARRKVEEELRGLQDALESERQRNQVCIT